MRPIYLDYNATTPLAPAVYTAMEPYLRTHFGNPSSDHPYGDIARQAVATARQQVATMVRADPAQVIVTGGGSEAINQVLKGLAFSRRKRGTHLITSAVEHPAVAQTMAWLATQGFQVTTVPVDQHGMVDPAAVSDAITDQTTLISIMHTQNEVGTIQPIAAIAALARERHILMHTDAAQSVGKIPVTLADLGIDVLTVAGHKFYGPKGIGAIVLRDDLPLPPLIHGAGHEQGRRAGTENVPSIVGLGVACALVAESLPQTADTMRRLRDTLEARLNAAIPGLLVNGHPTERLPNTLNVSLPDSNAAALLTAIRNQVAYSTGSACHAGHAAPSAVLLAMGRTPAQAAAALRLSLGRDTTGADIDQAAMIIGDAYHRLRLAGDQPEEPSA
ncbi:cysteine desulfurase family protein [Herpetosiphon sp. NSE202]|uniref:cysteine desulfurase family protein n=1 Tax=Herpetosiphon sp. NSE202 TaxID=3351349 RepID=UPI003627B6FF